MIIRIFANIEVAHGTNLVQICMIGMAKQQGTNVMVYSVTGSFMFNKTGNLIGYTSNTVTVKQSATTYVYGEHGEVKFTKQEQKYIIYEKELF